MSRPKDYRYKLGNDAIKFPKKGFIKMDGDVAIYDRLIRPNIVAKYGLVDLNDFSNFAKYRSAAEVTQLELAEATGLSLRTIQGWEIKGLNNAALISVAKIASVLNVKDLRELLDQE